MENISTFWVIIGAFTIYEYAANLMVRRWVAWPFYEGLPIFNRSIKLGVTAGASIDMVQLIEANAQLKRLGIKAHAAAPDEYLLIKQTPRSILRWWKTTRKIGVLSIRRHIPEGRFKCRISWLDLLFYAAIPVYYFVSLTHLDGGTVGAIVGTVIFLGVLSFHQYELRKKLNEIGDLFETVLDSKD